jgi:hypothetical protein
VVSGFGCFLAKKFLGLISFAAVLFCMALNVRIFHQATIVETTHICSFRRPYILLVSIYIADSYLSFLMFETLSRIIMKYSIM